MKKRMSKLTIVVGGAGFTGIEFLGELANEFQNFAMNMMLIKESENVFV